MVGVAGPQPIPTAHEGAAIEDSAVAEGKVVLDGDVGDGAEVLGVAVEGDELNAGQA